MSPNDRRRLCALILERVPPYDPWPQLRKLIAMSEIPNQHGITWSNKADDFVLNIVLHCETEGSTSDGSTALRKLLEAVVGLGGFEPEKLAELHRLIGTPSKPAAPARPSQPAPLAARGEGRRRALCIGIAEYDDESDLPDLNFSKADAADVDQVLRDYGGFDERRTLTGRVSVEQVREALTWLSQGLGPADVAVLFYSGHGCRLGASAALATSEWRPGGRGGVPIEDVRKLLDTRARVIQLLDACHLGQPHSKGDGDLSRLLTSHRSGWLCLAAADADQKAVERRALGHGLFTHYLLQALRGAVGHRQGEHLLVDAASVAGYVAFALKNDDAGQEPRIGADLVGLLVLTAVNQAPG